MKNLIVVSVSGMTVDEYYIGIEERAQRGGKERDEFPAKSLRGKIRTTFKHFTPLDFVLGGMWTGQWV
ncbi:hypothetical protein L195_g053033 [Trifolium pratense]|uniref:Uncharacterized protein n=1 Tax=Trifolium pratense TaxID=57577 RepID=A0A2K3K8B6_TRIPR|nr:hypothetical protein L195_g053033 [Trifolium pratense]